MAFFLIGRGPDDDLRLISPKSFESRQAAMAELSLLSAEPTFAHWDAEVSVMDLDTGAPVLLVRSGVAAAPAELPVVAPGDASGAWEADLPPAEEPAEEPALAAAAEADVAPLEPAPTAEPMLVAEASAPETPVAESDVVPDAIGAAFWEPPTMPLIEPVEDAAIADAIVEEAPAPEPEPELEAVQPPEPAVEPAIDVAAAREPAQETPVVAPAFDENDELRAAILRTTEHMSAEGVVPPASVGLEPAQAAAQPEASAEPELDAERSDAEPVVESGQPARLLHTNRADRDGAGHAIRSVLHRARRGGADATRTGRGGNEGPANNCPDQEEVLTFRPHLGIWRANVFFHSPQSEPG